MTRMTRRTPEMANGTAGAAAAADAAHHAARMARARVLAVDGRTARWRDDRLAGEEPLQIAAAGPGQEPIQVAVTMRTPGHEAELAIGFLFSEGLIGPGEVRDVLFGDPARDARPDDTIVVRLTVPFDATRVAERHFVATASCGICGKASIDEVAMRCEPLPDGPTVDQTTLVRMPEALRAAQETFEATGGLHASGLFEPDGTLVTVREDVGRHNALDKLIGERYLSGALPLHRSVLLVSGRISFELVQKAAVAGVPLLAAVGAPTDLAVATAERLGMTLVGFLRGERFNVYSRADRVRLGA
jgi:FdhD protein